MKKLLFTLLALCAFGIGSAQEPAVLPTINFEVVADGVFIIVENATSYDVTVDGVDLGLVDFVAATYHSQLIIVHAVNPSGETYESYELSAIQKQYVAPPVISTTMDDDYVYVHIEWPPYTDGERVYTGQDQYARTMYDYEVAVTAYVREGTQWLASEETHYVVEVPSNWKIYETPDPEVTTNLTDDQMIVTATGEGTVTLYVTVYGSEVGMAEHYTATGQGSASYAINRGTEDIMISYYATALADGDYDEVYPGISRSEYDVVPKKETPTPTVKTGAPTFQGYTEDGIHGYFVEIIPTEESVIYYRVIYPDGTETDWAEYEDILSFEGDGKHRVEAYAVAEGKLPSEEIAYEFVVAPITGIDELVDGKTVAGMRYFNMAGQEMSEANGLTIMVTTYTDGTTSAVKVIK